jgi:hypothetical protein
VPIPDPFDKCNSPDFEYLFIGKVYPERAQLTFRRHVKVQWLPGHIPLVGEISVILNQVAVVVRTDRNWDIYDLRNAVMTIVEIDLTIVGYVRGFAYELEITRVRNSAQEVDFVYGIGVPIISPESREIDPEKLARQVRKMLDGASSLYLTRCLADLRSAIVRASDTAFYCYRAIESLRRHHASMHELTHASDSAQWEAFREFCDLDEAEIRSLQKSADPLRHANYFEASLGSRAPFFQFTWQIVDRYIGAVSNSEVAANTN